MSRGATIARMVHSGVHNFLAVHQTGRIISNSRPILGGVVARLKLCLWNLLVFAQNPKSAADRKTAALLCGRELLRKCLIHVYLAFAVRWPRG